jgi:hypothetical protein
VQPTADAVFAPNTCPVKMIATFQFLHSIGAELEVAVERKDIRGSIRGFKKINKMTLTQRSNLQTPIEIIGLKFGNELHR